MGKGGGGRVHAHSLQLVLKSIGQHWVSCQMFTFEFSWCLRTHKVTPFSSDRCRPETRGFRPFVKPVASVRPVSRTQNAPYDVSQNKSVPGLERFSQGNNTRRIERETG